MESEPPVSETCDDEGVDERDRSAAESGLIDTSVKRLVEGQTATSSEERPSLSDPAADAERIDMNDIIIAQLCSTSTAVYSCIYSRRYYRCVPVYR